jgi:hypothetical protein
LSESDHFGVDDPCFTSAKVRAGPSDREQFDNRLLAID